MGVLKNLDRPLVADFRRGPGFHGQNSHVDTLALGVLETYLEKVQFR